jgi:hypothetical protein
MDILVKKVLITEDGVVTGLFHQTQKQSNLKFMEQVHPVLVDVAV